MMINWHDYQAKRLENQKSVGGRNQLEQYLNVSCKPL